MLGTEAWQVIEERVGSSGDADRQFVWGQRYLDDLVLRDRDTNGDGALDERLYGMQDANWNVTTVADSSGNVQERYACAAYGIPNFLTPSFGDQGSSTVAWEYLFAGYRWDSPSGLFHVRNRYLAPNLGVWIQRDPIGLLSLSGEIRIRSLTTYGYVANQPINNTDPSGLAELLLLDAPPAQQATLIATLVTALKTGGPVAAVALAKAVILTAPLTIPCSVNIKLFCVPDAEACFAAASVQSFACGAVACQPLGFKALSGRNQCNTRYAERFVAECYDGFLTCALSCGFVSGNRPHSCRPSPCGDLCANPNTCICTVFDNNTGQVVLSNITPNTTHEQCEAIGTTLKRQYPPPNFTVGCIFAC